VTSEISSSLRTTLRARVSGDAFNAGCANDADAPVKSENVIPATPKPVALLQVFRFAEFFARDI
jgi:hypothetical protein